MRCDRHASHSRLSHHRHQLSTTTTSDHFYNHNLHRHVLLTTPNRAPTWQSPMATFGIPLDYTISFTIVPDDVAPLGGWMNIMHLTATGNNCCVSPA
jgi:hypothetical protein